MRAKGISIQQVILGLALLAALWLVEWPERGAGGLPAADLQIELSVRGAGRGLRLVSMTPAGEEWVKRMEIGDDLRPLPESNP
jgi:tRNA threonylcarbamoyladenosine biosynthesis protein TsaE